MTITITLPNEIGLPLQAKADAEHRSVEDLAVDILTTALEANESASTPEEVVAKIQATPPNAHNVRSARGSLSEALSNAPPDPDFDLVTWQKDWMAVEAEMRALTRADDLSEAHG